LQINPRTTDLLRIIEDLAEVDREQLTRALNQRRGRFVLPGWVSGREDVAKYLGVSKRSISRWMKQGVLPHKRITSRLVMFRLQDLDRAVARMAEQFARSSND